MSVRVRFSGGIGDVIRVFIQLQTRRAKGYEAAGIQLVRCDTMVAIQTECGPNVVPIQDVIGVE